MVSFAASDDRATRSASATSSPALGNTPVTPVAVIGMACRLPGGIDSPDRLWDALLRGADLVTEIPPDRWDAADYYDPEPGASGRSVSMWGAFLDDVAGFDAEFFGITEREATASDPQHRLLLETSWEAMEHAGLTPQRLTDSPTGVFVGLTHGDYQLLAADAHALTQPHGFTGTSPSLASGRIAHALGLHGPALTVDTAGSSGLTAVHLACRSLHERESALALAGGVALALDPRRWAAGSAEGVLSPTGRCHAFDAAADGFVPGEGCAVVVLKRLADAQHDGDRILAVIRGTAAHHDGRTVSIATPSRSAQVAAYREALAAGGVQAGSVGMVEAHGSGSPTGDAIEYAGLAEVYGADGPCALAAVTTNFGHTQSAAGVLGLLKTVLAVRHGVIPQNLHFTRLPDELAAIKTNLFVPQENTTWPSGHPPRRAAVSSYGLSGTTVHAVVEQAPDIPKASEIPDTDALPGGQAGPTTAPLLFALSSTSADELRRSAARLADWVAAHRDVTLPDLAYTLARRRAHRPVRAAVIASSRTELTGALRELADGDTEHQAAVGRDDRGPVWVFSGQGSQWAAMGARLLATEPVFAATVAQAEPLIARESGFSVTEALTAAEAVTGQDRIQPALFTMQVALAATLKAYGARPGAVIGHSLGEAAAAVAAGALSLDDGVRVVCRRSRLMSRVAGAGATASVELPAQQVLSELMARGIRDVVVAIVASPQSTVISGAAPAVHELVAAWRQRDVAAREIRTDVAFHSPLLDPILDELRDALAELRPTAPEVPFYSTTLFDPREQPLCDARYWADNTRRMVRFATAVQAALEDGYRVFAELAPHPLLTDALEQTAAGLEMPLAALAAMRCEHEPPHGLRGFVAELHNAGAAVDFSVLYPTGRLVDAPLPAWTHRHLWLSHHGQESPAAGGCTVSAHPLLGAHVRLPEEPERHVWQAETGTAAQPWLAEHRVHGVAVLPGAAYCEMALAAAHTVFGRAAEARDIRFEHTLPLDEHITVNAAASVHAPDVADFTVDADHGGERARRAAAVLRVLRDEAPPPAQDVSALLATHPSREDGTEVRKRLELWGIQYGPAFAGLIAVRTGPQLPATVLAEVALPRQLRSQQDAYVVHPALLDACLQSVAAHPDVRALGEDAPVVPLGVGRLRVHGAARNARYCYTRVTKAGASGVEADIDVLDEHGTVLLAVRGLRLGAGASETAHKDRVLNERLLSIEWRQRESPEADHRDAGSWLLITTTVDAPAAALEDALKSLGAYCISICWPQRADHTASAQQLRNQLRSGGCSGAVILTGPAGADTENHLPRLGRDYVRHLVRITRELADMPGAPPRLYVVTHNAQTVVEGDVANLEQAGLRGMLRVIGVEHPLLRATQIDIDPGTDAQRLARQLLSGSDEDETAWRNGAWYTARLRRAPLRPEDRHSTVVSRERDGLRLQIRTPGDLETLEPVAADRVAPGPGQIEVAVGASSVNYADVLVALGRYPAVEGQRPQLGTDFAGVVTAVGPDVTGHQVGDHVGGLGATGCWGTFVTCDARLAVTLPAGLSDAQAAAVTTPYTTAYYGLHELARIKAGDRVLIHSATGGVGQAALAIARAAGANIFATAGSEQRRQLLRDMGIERVYDSRSLEFAEAIRRDTQGYGVDIVLNSVTGAAQRAGLELLAHGGRFVEIGKRDIGGDTRLGSFLLRRNLAFYGVDLASLADSDPDRLREVLSTVYRLTADGSLPPPHLTRYPLADAAAAIRQISGARHTGKLVLDIPRTGRTRVVVPPAQVRVCRGDGAYIITGGLGGLGLFLAEKIASLGGGAGCGRFVLCSRSQPTPEALQVIERMRALGAEVVVERGDITRAETAARLVGVATATGRAVRGVLHLAAAREDAPVSALTEELLDRNWAPKVCGAWNLHTATAGQPLDWFCSFSSVAALVGAPGQGAGAAADSWLDAFTRWRRAQGLPATVIAWGAWARIGRATAPDTAPETAGGATIAPEEGAYAFDALLRHDRASTGYAPLSGAPWLTALAQRSPVAEAFRSSGQHLTGTSALRAELAELPVDEWPARLRHLISDQVSRILRRSVDPDRPLSGYGLDSLAALELRTRIETETGIRLAATDFSTVTIRGLAELLCERLAPAQAT